MCNFFFSMKLDNFGDVSLHYQSMIHNKCNSMHVQQSVKLRITVVQMIWPDGAADPLVWLLSQHSVTLRKFPCWYPLT